MERVVGYRTKQREAILEYIISNKDTHVTAAQVVEHFEKESTPIGRTTVYRHLDKLSESGRLRKYITDGVSGACYQLAEDKEDCRVHLHLKCDGCGKLQHLDCDMLDDIQKHVHDQHSFEVNAMKTVLYGKCDDCLHPANTNVYEVQ